MKRMCRSCQKRPALFQVRGHWKSDDDHDLCRQCYDSEHSREMAQQLCVKEFSRSAGNGSRMVRQER